MTFDILRWLEDIGLDQYGEIFIEQGFDREGIAALTDSDLQDLGVKAMGHRKIILREAPKLALTPDTDADAALPAAPLASARSSGVRPPSTPDDVPAAPIARADQMGPTPTKTRFIDRFPKYWARGESGNFLCWRSSDESFEAAQKAANIRAAKLEAHFRATGSPTGDYLYSDKPVREELIEVVGEAVVSRNAYGALILNSPDVLFVDIDFPPFKPPGFLQRLFGANIQDEFDAHMKAQVERVTNYLTTWTDIRNENDAHDAHTGPTWGWRVYRTLAGMRLIATHDYFEPDSADVREIFEELDADPLYAKLCQVQKSFRARLSPKPWRCGVERLAARWPWQTKKEEKKFARWLTQYDAARRNYATCELVTTIGNTTLPRTIAQIVSFHDTATGVDQDFPLA